MEKAFGSLTGQPNHHGMEMKSMIVQSTVNPHRHKQQEVNTATTPRRACASERNVLSIATTAAMSASHRATPMSKPAAARSSSTNTASS